MRISPIQQQNYNNSNLNFKGSIDKSFTKYLKTVRSDIIRTQSGPKNFGLETIKEAKDLINNIVTKLKPFMEETSENTVLYLAKLGKTDFGGELGELRFKSLKTGAEIPAARLKGYSEDNVIRLWDTDMKITITPMQDNDVLWFLGVKGKHDNVLDLRMISQWTDALTTKALPARVDLALILEANDYKTAKDLNKALERMHLSEVEKRNLEMKDAIKELKDIEI